MSEYLDWKVGDQVVCVDAVEHDLEKDNEFFEFHGSLDGLKEGEIYIIRDFYIDTFDSVLCIRLNEIHRSFDDTINAEAGYRIKRFRKVQKRKYDISVFQAMLTKTPAQNKKELENV